MSKSIRKTAFADLETVMAIYTYAREYMKETGNPNQWGDRHPPQSLIENDIKTGLSYVYETDGHISAVFYFEIAPDPTYAAIDGQWVNDSAPYGVIHRIARAKEAKGAGKACLEWCFSQCHNLRIDTHKDNQPMIKLLENLGYEYCGIIRLGLFGDPDMDSRYAYQKFSPLHRMKELAAKLQEAAKAYYHENRELMTDREYDTLYDELLLLEAKTNTILAGSPTQKVGYETVSSLQKVTHTTPMLSLDKTKEPSALADFLGEHTGLLTWKLDGLALSLTYENGSLSQALTRGNGIIGEDVTHNARVFANLPLTVAYKGKFTVRGEAVISYEDFKNINTLLPAGETYKNPRNLCSGTVRQLNNEVTASRKVRFYAIGITGETDATVPANLKSTQLKWLYDLGFETVPSQTVTADTVVETLNMYKDLITKASIATDGLVLTFDDIAFSESLGATSKFPRDSVAFKWADELQETTLREIEWNTSRTGLINPVAIFDPVELEGTSVSRASVHNVSILRELDLRKGDRITVYKANMIIPQIAENLNRRSHEFKTNKIIPQEAEDDDYCISEFTTDIKAPPLTEEIDIRTLDSLDIPAACPVCGGSTEIVPGPSGEALHCTGQNCGAKRLQALTHFVSRNAMNIDGLSEQTLEKFISLGMIDDYPDIFRLTRHGETIINMEGFGKKSYDNLITAINKAKTIALPNFIYALGIRHVGLANAKLLCAYFSHDINKIITACTDEGYPDILGEIKGFGEAISNSLHAYFSDGENIRLLDKILPLLDIQIPPETPSEKPLSGLTFVITGDVRQYKNRKDLQTFIESQGGKVTNAVTVKTSYLINNDISSNSGKNKKAAELGVPVLTEEGLYNLL